MSGAKPRDPHGAFNNVFIFVNVPTPDADFPSLRLDSEASFIPNFYIGHRGRETFIFTDQRVEEHFCIFTASLKIHRANIAFDRSFENFLARLIGENHYFVVMVRSK